MDTKLASEVNEKRYQPVSIDLDLYGRCEELAKQLRRPVRQYVQEALEAIEALHKAPKDKRRVPLIVAELDLAEEHKRVAQLLAPPNSTDPAPSRLEQAKAMMDEMDMAKYGKKKPSAAQGPKEK